MTRKNDDDLRMTVVASTQLLFPHSFQFVPRSKFSRFSKIGFCKYTTFGTTGLCVCSIEGDISSSFGKNKNRRILFIIAS